MTACVNHGPSAWCYIQDDGFHVDSERCRCFGRASFDCIVDQHRREAGRRFYHAVQGLTARGKP